MYVRRRDRRGRGGIGSFSSLIGPVLFSCTTALVQLVGVKGPYSEFSFIDKRGFRIWTKESMFVSFQLIALVQQCS